MYLEESFADPGFNLSVDTSVFLGLFLWFSGFWVVCCPVFKSHMKRRKKCKWIKGLGFDDKTMNRKTEDNLIIKAYEMKSNVIQGQATLFAVMRISLANLNQSRHLK